MGLRFCILTSSQTMLVLLAHRPLSAAKTYCILKISWVQDITLRYPYTIDLKSDPGLWIFNEPFGWFWYRWFMRHNLGNATLAQFGFPQALLKHFFQLQPTFSIEKYATRLKHRFGTIRVNRYCIYQTNRQINESLCSSKFGKFGLLCLILDSR